MIADKISETLEGLYSRYSACDICPHRCGVYRTRGELGKCGVGVTPLVASYGPHYGEEPELVGKGGSGTIFLAGCNLQCVFCQNYDVSHKKLGTPATPDHLAMLMLALQGRGCENINLVTPTHFTPSLADAIVIARQDGLTIPVVWNCGGYENVDVLRSLEGLVQIYLPDAKYGPKAQALELSGAADYFDRMCEAITEMHRQVGDLMLDGRGVAVEGLVVRHLVLPNGSADSEAIMDFIAGKLSRDTYINIMSQYRPCFETRHYKKIDRAVKPYEIDEVKSYARRIGLYLGF